MLPIGLCAQLACIWEASARKPGNVHRHRDFEDVSYLDFLASAAAIAPEMETAPFRRVGETVLAAVRATRDTVRTNTNLGIILLLAPLAAVPRDHHLFTGVEDVLARLDIEDSRLVYDAIRVANPAGLGEVEHEDVREEPSRPLGEVMALAAERDLVALQYVSGFKLVSEVSASLCEMTGGIEERIISCQLQLLSAHPDSLIARKRGLAEAQLVSERARQVVNGKLSRDAFDAWLREDGHARNPGTTADLIAAGLFAALREGGLTPFEGFATQ